MFRNALNLQHKKKNQVIKRIFTVIIISAIIFSCNDENSKNQTTKEDRISEEVKSEKNTELIYLDTSENISNILCQDWVLADDADGLEGMEENSKFEIPYRSFYFSTKGTFVKNPRNTFDYGNWIYDDAAKTITLNNSIDRAKDIYKIAKITTDELTLVNVGVNSATNLKFIAQVKGLKMPMTSLIFWKIIAGALNQKQKNQIRPFISG